jgi:hypothetical protein
MNKAFSFISNDGKFHARVEIKLTDGDKPVFTSSISYRQAGHHEECGCGQCFMDMYDIFKHHRLFVEIVDLWEQYHLNNLHAGTEKQEACLSEWEKTLKAKPSHSERCEYLTTQDLLYDNGYKYGSSWLYRAIPERDLKRIKALFTLGE